MPENHTPRICFFSWLPQPRLRGGPRLRWRDVVRNDLKTKDVSEEKWYDEASVSRPRWKSKAHVYKEGLLVTAKKPKTALLTR